MRGFLGRNFGIDYTIIFNGSFTTFYGMRKKHYVQFRRTNKEETLFLTLLTTLLIWGWLHNHLQHILYNFLWSEGKNIIFNSKEYIVPLIADKVIEVINIFINIFVVFYRVAVGSQRGVLWASLWSSPRRVHRYQQIGHKLDHISRIWPLEE